MDCIWGFTQIKVDEQTSRIHALITRRGVLRPKVLFFGAKQGPSIFQSMMDSTFGRVRGDDGEEYVAIFMDDVSLSTDASDTDGDFDLLVNKHIRH